MSAREEKLLRIYLNRFPSAKLLCRNSILEVNISRRRFMLQDNGFLKSFNRRLNAL